MANSGGLEELAFTATQGGSSVIRPPAPKTLIISCCTSYSVISRPALTALRMAANALRTDSCTTCPAARCDCHCSSDQRDSNCCTRSAEDTISTPQVFTSSTVQQYVLESKRYAAAAGPVSLAIYSTWILILRSSKVGLEAAAQVQRERIAVRTIEDSLTCIQSFQASMKYLTILLSKKATNPC